MNDLAAIREQMYWPDGSERDEWEAIEDVKAQRRALLAHIDALTAKVEAATFQVPRECDCHKGEMRNAQEPEEYRAAVLAILRGEA